MRKIFKNFMYSINFLIFTFTGVSLIICGLIIITFTLFNLKIEVLFGFLLIVIGILMIRLGDILKEYINKINNNQK